MSFSVRRRGAVVASAAVLVGLVIAVLPKAPAVKPAAKPEFQFGADRVRPNKKRPTIFKPWSGG